MRPEDAFLADIIEHPEDDTPRLVFADWLEENAQGENSAQDCARAEFIRLQCALACLPGQAPERAEMLVREGRLLREMSGPWLALLPAWARDEAVFRRGFVEEIKATASAFLRGGAKLMQRFPLRVAHLSEMPEGRMRELADLPILSRLDRLSLGLMPVVGQQLPILLHHIGVQRIRHLGFTFEDGYIGGLEAIPLSFTLRNLTDLTIRGFIGPEGAAHLAAGPRNRLLENLECDYAGIGDRGLLSLADSPLLRGLRRLRFTHCQLTPSGIMALAAASKKPGLVELNLRGNRVGDRGAQALSESPWLSGLTVLNLDSAEIAAEGANFLALSPHLANLEELSLNYTSLGQNGIRNLADSPHLEKLKTLRLWGCGASEPAVRYLLNAPALKNLHTLVIGDSGTSKKQLQALREEFSGRVKIV